VLRFQRHGDAMPQACHAIDYIDPPFMAPLECVMDIPFPPSTNKLWRISGRRNHLSAEYQAWRKQADMAVIANGTWRNRVAMPAHFTALILLSTEHRTARTDGDNRIKACLDWAQRIGLITNDAKCDEVTARWVPTHEAPHGARLVLRSVA
jgi:Holliday junction resolvase RusA-like endonuclease